MTTENFEFLEELKNPVFGEFKAEPKYDFENDFLIFKSECSQTYTRWVNNQLSLIKNMEDNRVIGFKIKGIKQIIKRAMRLGQAKRIGEDKYSISIGLILCCTTETEEDISDYNEDFNKELELQLT